MFVNELELDDTGFWRMDSIAPGKKHRWGRPAGGDIDKIELSKRAHLKLDGLGLEELRSKKQELIHKDLLFRGSAEEIVLQRALIDKYTDQVAQADDIVSKLERISS